MLLLISFPPSFPQRVTTFFEAAFCAALRSQNAPAVDIRVVIKLDSDRGCFDLLRRFCWFFLFVNLKLTTCGRLKRTNPHVRPPQRMFFIVRNNFRRRLFLKTYYSRRIERRRVGFYSFYLSLLLVLSRHKSFFRDGLNLRSSFVKLDIFVEMNAKFFFIHFRRFFDEKRSLFSNCERS